MKYKNFHSPEREILSKRFSQIPSIEIGLVSIIENYIYGDSQEVKKYNDWTDIHTEIKECVLRFNKKHGIVRTTKIGLITHFTEFMYDNGKVKDKIY
jgi:hypothetical protein